MIFFSIFLTRIEQTLIWCTRVPHAYIYVHVYIAYYTHCPCSPYIILHSPYHILIQVFDKVDTETSPLRLFQV